VSVPLPSDYKDLSLDHQLLGALGINELSNHKDYQALELSSEQVEKFWHDGFLSNIRVLDEAQCSLLLSEYEKFLVIIFT